jgi:hypothetical protein
MAEERDSYTSLAENPLRKRRLEKRTRWYKEE